MSRRPFQRVDKVKKEVYLFYSLYFLLRLPAEACRRACFQLFPMPDCIGKNLQTLLHPPTPALPPHVTEKKFFME
jgi:hypothetical protein